MIAADCCPGVECDYSRRVAERSCSQRWTAGRRGHGPACRSASQQSSSQPQVISHGDKYYLVQLKLAQYCVYCLWPTNERGQVRVRTGVAQHFWTSQILSNNSKFCYKFGIWQILVLFGQISFGKVWYGLVVFGGLNIFIRTMDRQNKSLVWFG